MVPVIHLSDRRDSHGLRIASFRFRFPSLTAVLTPFWDRPSF